jgi:hypothetical protein
MGVGGNQKLALASDRREVVCRPLWGLWHHSGVDVWVLLTTRLTACHEAQSTCSKSSFININSGFWQLVVYGRFTAVVVARSDAPKLSWSLADAFHESAEISLGLFYAFETGVLIDFADCSDKLFCLCSGIRISMNKLTKSLFCQRVLVSFSR